MEAFKIHRGAVAPLDRANIDTDQIIAKQFLKSILRTGFGPQLFYDWAHNPDGSVNPSFSLNDPRYKDASILIAGNNFGCGSSREHAVWAIAQHGFKVVIAPTNRMGADLIPAFADIFKNNCGKNGIVTVEIGMEDYRQLMAEIGKSGSRALEMTVDLAAQTITLHAPSGDIRKKFEYDQAVKDRLLNGLDDIGITLKYESDLKAFEARHDAQIPRG